MSKSLPANPNLEYLKKEAKDLHAAFLRGDPAALPVVRHLRYLDAIPDAELLIPGRTTVSLQHMQGALAAAYGFRDWKHLADHVGGGNREQATDVEQVADFDNLTIQVVLRDLEDDTVAAVAGAASPRLRQRLFDNVTGRHRERLERSAAFTAPDGVAAGRTAVLAVLNRLVAMGDIAGLGTRRAAGVEGAEDRATWARRVRERFAADAGPAPVSTRANADLIPVLRALGSAARRDGLLALDALVEGTFDETYMADGVRALADGEDLDRIGASMTRDAAALLEALDRRQALVIEGVTRLGAAYRPEAMHAALQAHPGAAAAPDLVAFFTAMAERTVAGGLIAIEGEAAGMTDDLLRTGLQPLVDGTDVEFVRQIMDARARALRARLAQRLEMVRAAILWVGTGMNPRLIELQCQAML